jgi:hypothetical protein
MFARLIIDLLRPQVEAVVAPEIAVGADGLDKELKRTLLCHACR